MAKNKKIVKKIDLKKSKIEVEKSAERKEGWFRILVLIITGIILSVWSILIKVLIIVNFFIAIIAGKRNQDIAEFCEYFNTEAYKFIRYITFVNNIRPFPFSSMERISKFE